MVHTIATVTAAPQEERTSPVGAILALDRVVQKRFEHVNRGFGLDRISTAHGFKPETDAELSSVRELDEAHLTVGLYLAGRAFLEGRRHGGPLSDWIKGPVAVTQDRFFPATPAIESMLGEGRRAFAAFERGESQQEFDSGKWTVVARPVRANGSCLKCHRSTGGGSPYDSTPLDLRVGNVLGVVFYAYQPAGAK